MLYKHFVILTSSEKKLSWYWQLYKIILYVVLGMHQLILGLHAIINYSILKHAKKKNISNGRN